jgi:predicted transcriptional regulator
MANKDKMSAIRLESDQYKRLQELGELQDRPVSWLIRKAVEEFLQKNSRKKSK